MTQAFANAVEVRVADVRRRSADSDDPRYSMVLLKEVAGTRSLPIWVGPFEATSIALHLEGVRVPRPLTFSFMSDLLEACGGRLREVRVNKLVEGTFYAVAVIEASSGVRTVDARPSDALALALVAGVPVRVEASIFAASDAHLAAHEHVPPPEAYHGEGTEGAAEIVAEVRSKWPGFRPGPTQTD